MTISCPKLLRVNTDIFTRDCNQASNSVQTGIKPSLACLYLLGLHIIITPFGNPSPCVVEECWRSLNVWQQWLFGNIQFDFWLRIADSWQKGCGAAAAWSADAERHWRDIVARRVGSFDPEEDGWLSMSYKFLSKNKVEEWRNELLDSIGPLRNCIRNGVRWCGTQFLSRAISLQALSDLYTK